MISVSLQRITRRTSTLGLALLATLLATSTVRADTYYSVTDGYGNIVPAAAGLYTVTFSCYNAGGPPMPATICTWLVRKLYGDQNPVVIVVDQPHATSPGCQNGATTMIKPGYLRIGCAVYASSSVYGN